MKRLMILSLAAALMVSSMMQTSDYSSMAARRKSRLAEKADTINAYAGSYNTGRKRNDLNRIARERSARLRASEAERLNRAESLAAYAQMEPVSAHERAQYQPRSRRSAAALRELEDAYAGVSQMPLETREQKLKALEGLETQYVRSTPRLAEDVKAMSRAYKGYEAPMQNLRNERLAGYTGLELNPDQLPEMGLVGPEVGQYKNYSGTFAGTGAQRGSFKTRLPGSMLPYQLQGYDANDITPEMVEAYEQSLPSTVDSYQPGRSWGPQGWRDYFNSQYGIDKYAAKRRAREFGYNYLHTPIMNTGDWVSDKISGAYAKVPSMRGAPAAVETADVLSENALQAQLPDQSAPQPGVVDRFKTWYRTFGPNNPSKLPQPPVAESPEYAGYRIPMPSWETVKGTPSRIWNYFGENNRSALEETRKLQAEQAQNPEYAGYRISMPSWETVKGTPNRIWNYFGENNRSALEETRKLQAEQNQNAGPVGYRIPTERALQYIPGTPAYKQRMENEARDEKARKKLQDTRQEILNLQRKLGI